MTSSWRTESDPDIVPSLEVVGALDPEALLRLLPRLGEFATGGLCTSGSEARRVAFVSDNCTDFSELAARKASDIAALFDRFRADAMRPVRHRTTYWEVSPLRSHAGLDDSAVQVVRSVSFAGNFLPQQVSAIALRTDTAGSQAWDDLSAIRTELVDLLGDCFLWSTIGFRFRLNRSCMYESGIRQSALGQRLLGIDWDDPFGAYTSLSLYGLRSISWQTLVAQSTVRQWTGRISDCFGASRVGEREHLLWQAGARPSHCDRHGGPQLDIREYARVGTALSSMCQHFDTEWFGQSSFETWSRRWEEFC